MQDWLNDEIKKSREMIPSDVYPIFWTHIYLV